MGGGGRTGKAVKLCAEWLNYCLSVGYPRSRLDALEKLWWDHHDCNGNLTSAFDAKELNKELE